MENEDIKIYFSDFFEIDHEALDAHGALDISLLSDNPAFVDPFLIFYSKKAEYIKLHDFIVKYLVFLKNQSDTGQFSPVFYSFHEVNQVWLGFSKGGNKGLGLGDFFAKELHENLVNIFKGAKNNITKSSHIEKLCIVGERVGADKISDFTINLIKEYLVRYTEKFAKQYLDESKTSTFRISKLYFDFNKNNWVDGEAILPINPFNKSEYILLTPKDILVKEEGWISVNSFLNEEGLIIEGIPNADLRYKINQYFLSLIPEKKNKKGQQEKDFSKKYTRKAIKDTAKKYPELIDYFIRKREEAGEGALEASLVDNEFLRDIFFLGVKSITETLKKEGFYADENGAASFSEAVKRIKIFKHVMETRDGFKIFWDGTKLRKFKEAHVDILIDLIFASSNYSIDKQVNNGRGPSDFKVSNGAKDCTLIETKLAKNTHLERNLLNQLNIYKEANETSNGIYVILFFSDSELIKVNSILEKLKMNDFVDKWIYVIDCRRKISASLVE